MRQWLLNLLMTVLLLYPALARATFSCSLQSVVGVNFGNYNPFNGQPTSSQGQLIWRCDGDVPQVIQINLNYGNNGTFSPRRMSQTGSPNEKLDYNLFLDAPFQTIWGDGSAGTFNYTPMVSSNNGNLGIDVTVFIYGRIPEGQDVPVGSYSDTIIVTLVY
jgi:spore coat protein U-like protein